MPSAWSSDTVSEPVGSRPCACSKLAAAREVRPFHVPSTLPTS